MPRSPAVARLLPLAALALALAPGRAEAFPWMIHHGYTNCAQCHVDPSGGGVLTDYGRAQGEILLRTLWSPAAEDPSAFASFGFGAFDLPEFLELQADVRGMVIPQPGNVRLLLMQSDLRGAVQAGAFVASAGIGVVSEGGEQAWITSSESTRWNLVSREYWAGATPAKGWMVRAGRMNQPFGIRTEDHILKVRSVTRTTSNDDQTLGLAVLASSRKLRAEVMGIAGNVQVRPDAFRERGYSGYVAWAPISSFELGASSKYTRAEADVATLAPRTFMAHGLHTRAAVVPELAVMAEADLLLEGDDAGITPGLTGLLLLDWEPTQGLHLQGIGEYCDGDLADPASPAWTGMGAAQWFFAPRVDLRVDAGYGVLGCSAGADPGPLALLQGHFYL